MVLLIVCPPLSGAYYAGVMATSDGLAVEGILIVSSLAACARLALMLTAGINPVIFLDTTSSAAYMSGIKLVRVFADAIFRTS